MKNDNWKMKMPRNLFLTAYYSVTKVLWYFSARHFSAEDG
jgi:hypothetical protein